MSRRPGLRSRVYSSTLGVVENNYKEAMARLEKSRRPSSVDREQTTRSSPFASRPSYDFNGDEFDEDLSLARSRAAKVIHEKSVIDARSEKLRSHSLAPVASAVLENDFDEQVRYRRFLLRRSSVNRDNSVIYVIPLPSDSHYIPRSYYDYYNYYNYYNSTTGCGWGCS